MNPLRYFTVLVFPVILASGQEISTPQKRMVSLDLARTLLTTQTTIDTADRFEGQNPFNPKPAASDVAVDVPVPVAVVAVADRERLALLAPMVTPTGSVQIGGKGILLFGQKRLKVGDVVPIIFQGSTYELQISAIDRTTFTLRLNNEEITRPIKPVK